MLTVFKLLLAFFALTMPGYVLARLLRLPWSWAVAFPFSALLLAQLVTLFSVAGVPLGFSPMAASICCLTAVGIILLRLRKPIAEVDACEAPLQPLSRLEISCLGLALLVVTGVAFRTTLYPLSGFDTSIRWEALARQMLLRQSLDFYPPVTAADFSTYLIPDGIPPLVASVYWWLYAAVGKPLQQVTAFPVALQLLSAMALTFYGTLLAFGRWGAFLALLALATSSMLINGIAIGQETGYTALAVAGQFYCAWVAVRRPSGGPVIAAALFAALGAMARDYGPVLAVTGFIVLAWQAQTRRYLGLFVVTAVVMSAPWYLRNWMVSGNPLYPRGIMGLFPVNEVYEAPQNILKESFSFYCYSFFQWLGFVGVLLAGAPLAIPGGIAYGVARWREAAPLMVTTVLLIVLWLISMGVTGDAGALYSMLLLTPAFLACSILAGAGGSYLYEFRERLQPAGRMAIAGVLLAASLYSITGAFSHPFPPQNLFSALGYRHAGPPEFCLNSLSLAEQLQSSSLPACGVLTSNAYMGVILQRETRFRPVMNWSPEVKFVFDRTLGVAEIRRRLAAKNIRIVYLDYVGGKGNNLFAGEFPFFAGLFREQAPPGFKLIAGAGNEALFLLTDDK